MEERIMYFDIRYQHNKEQQNSIKRKQRNELSFSCWL